MKKPLLIADSGGSKTDWCRISPDGSTNFFTTRSYHPIYWNEGFFAEEKAFWNNSMHVAGEKLIFFGAGCLRDFNAQFLRKEFLDMGFSEVQVFSDVHAAGKALLGDRTGTIAIMGTGSVAAHFEAGELRSIYGGLGHILGDEGSGYYFGKLLLTKLLNNELTDLEFKLYDKLGDRNTILAEVYGEKSKEYIASLSKRLAEWELTELYSIHAENFKAFLKPLENKGLKPELAVCGSYAFHMQDVLRYSLREEGWELTEVIERPIHKLTEYFLKTSF
jgi:glucosamine kinase